MPRRRVLYLASILVLCMAPAHAEGPNLATGAAAAPGAATQLVLAQRVFRQAMATGEPILLLAAIRLARGVTTRPAPSWTRETGQDAPPVETPGGNGPPDPGSAAALAVLQGMSVDDPNLQDLAYDLDAQLPHVRQPVATVAKAGVGAGAQDDWRVPLSGAVPAEIALIGDGQTPLGLTVTDDSGAVVCVRPAATDPALCRFTPARNGFFLVHVKNAGAVWNTYLLLGN
jgi:hypothetical protein